MKGLIIYLKSGYPILIKLESDSKVNEFSEGLLKCMKEHQFLFFIKEEEKAVILIKVEEIVGFQVTDFTTPGEEWKR